MKSNFPLDTTPLNMLAWLYFDGRTTAEEEATSSPAAPHPPTFCYGGGRQTP